jgi:hypothetical protein
LRFIAFLTIKHMRFNSLVIIILVLLISSCTPKKDYVLKVKLLQLTESEMYNGNMVYDVIFDSEENNIDSLKGKGRKLFLEGIDLYKNKKKPELAINIFKSSIMVFPDAKTYYELGNALLESQTQSTLEEALQAFEVAERLNFQPIANVYYKEACANNLLYLLDNKLFPEKDEKYRNKALYCLRDAFENGFFDTTALKNDNKINYLAKSREYQKIIIDILLKREKGSSNALFDLFKESFPLTVQHLEIPLEKVDMGDYKDAISYDFAQFIPEMENTDFGREVSHDYFYVAKISETPEYTALVYSSISYWGEKMQPVHTTLATFNKDGKIISKKLIACQCSAEKVKKGTIDNNTILIGDYKRIWEKPIDQVPFDENTVKSYELMAEVKFRIDDFGNITDQEVPANYNDTIIVASIKE